VNGLFHRLARQVVGPALPRARSTARLPFVALPLIEDRQAPYAFPRDEASLRPSAPRPATTAEPPLAPEPSRPAEPAAVRATEQLLSLEDDRSPHAVRAGPVDEPSPVRIPAGREAMDTVEVRIVRTAMVADQRAAIGPPAPRSPGGKRRGGPRAIPEAAELPRAIRVPAPLMSDTHEPPPRLPPDTREPLPPMRPERATSPDERTGMERRTGRDVAPTEVHVHIGRIEVTSLSEPGPKAQIRPRRGKPPMTLDEYLARRQAGS
jgi:hypothetical protein